MRRFVLTAPGLPLVVCLAAALALPGSGMQAQEGIPVPPGPQTQTPPVFRAEANLVEVIVRVTDEQGRFVAGLAARDFELREQNRVQSIVAFDAVSLPRAAALSPARARPSLAAPDMSTVITNERAHEARLFVLLLDDLMVDSLLTIPVRRVARQFVERHVGPSDLIAVLSTTGRDVLTQDFTTDKARALAAIDRFMGQGCSWHETLYAVDFMGTLAEHLRGVQGRRVSVVWISEAVGLSMIAGTGLTTGGGGIGDAMGSGRTAPLPVMEVLTAIRRVQDTFRQHNLTLYSIDPRGLFAPGPDALGCYAQTTAERAASLASLQNFAEYTGGFAAINTNDFAPAFDRIIDENSDYYVLGYQPAQPGRPGDSRRIRVTVPGRRDLRVSARPGYVVPTAQPTVVVPNGVPPTLAVPLVTNVPTPGLPLRVQAIPRRGTADAARVQVLVEIPGHALRFTEANGRAQAQVRFALRTIDNRARARHDLAHTIDLSLTPEEAGRLRQAGVRWTPTVDLGPGHYSLRVSGEVAGLTRVGSVFADIDVPKFDDDQDCPPLLPELCGLWVGGLAITSLPASLYVTRGTSPITLGLPAPPTTTRTFVLGDVLTVSADVATPRGFRHGTMRLTVHEDTAAPDDLPVWYDAVALDDRAAAHTVRPWRLETSALGAGTFVLRLRVFDNRDRWAETSMLFHVVPAPEGAGR